MLSTVMILLTLFIFLFAVISAQSFITKHKKWFYILTLLLFFILIGIFTTNNIFIFFLLWELELIPMYFLIKYWGNKKAEKSALKFLIYTFGGSLFLLVGLLLICYFNSAETGSFTTNINNIDITGLNTTLQVLINIFLLIGFGVKIPIVPLHKWLVETHSNSATPVSIILAGILLKLGLFGILRFNIGLVPIGFIYLSPIIGCLSIINMFYGAGLAYVQKNAKRLIAASSISQMGIPLLGLSSMNLVGINGAIYHMIAHGIIAAGLFTVAGILKNRFITEDLELLIGVGSHIPQLSGYTILISLAGMGVPLLCGFIGEFLSIYSAMSSPILLFKIYALFGTIILILSAFYILKLLHNIFYGTPIKAYTTQFHLEQNENNVLIIISILVVLLGCFPNLILSLLNI